jgi:hypothetical protein
LTLFRAASWLRAAALWRSSSLEWQAIGAAAVAFAGSLAIVRLVTAALTPSQWRILMHPKTTEEVRGPARTLHKRCQRHFTNVKQLLHTRADQGAAIPRAYR